MRGRSMAQATCSAELLAFITAIVALNAESVISDAAIAIRLLPNILGLPFVPRHHRFGTIGMTRVSLAILRGGWNDAGSESFHNSPY